VLSKNEKYEMLSMFVDPLKIAIPEQHII